MATVALAMTQANLVDGLAPHDNLLMAAWPYGCDNKERAFCVARLFSSNSLFKCIWLTITFLMRLMLSKMDKRWVRVNFDKCNGLVVNC